MKKINLIRLTLQNFKGIRNLNIEFAPNTTIMGDNSTGKTTVMDAFTWLLFGKDSQDRKDFNIKTIENDQVIEKIEHSVEGEFRIDGEPLVIRRTLKENWTKRRGDVETTFTGNDTLYYYNEVPLKAGEYSAKINAIIDETVFKLITNPLYFTSMKWQDQRNHLFLIGGDVSDAYVLDKMATLNNKDMISNITNILNSGKSLSEFKREIAARKKKLKDDLQTIPARIDQTRKMMPEMQDFALIEQEAEGLKAEIAEIDRSLSDRSTAIRSQYEAIQTKRGEINRLKTEQQNLVHKAKQKAQDDAFASNERRRDLENQLSASVRKESDIDREIKQLEAGIKALDQEIGRLEGEKQKLRDSWHAENAKEYKKEDGCLICPLWNEPCNDSNSLSRKAEAGAKAEEQFYDTKSKKLDSIGCEGLGVKNAQESYSADISLRKISLSEAQAKLEATKSESAQIREQLSQTQIAVPEAIFPEDIPGYVELSDKIQEIESTIEDVPQQDNTELTSRKREISVRLDAAKAKLGDKARIEAAQKEVNRLLDEERSLSQQIADLERTEFTIQEFTKSKIDECERRINSRFSTVKFRLFEQQINGGEVETCVALVDGVPFSDVNTAGKINAGLDIINTLSDFHKVSAPIFIDNRESVNQLLDTQSQIVNLIVTKDKSLVINN